MSFSSSSTERGLLGSRRAVSGTRERIREVESPGVPMDPGGASDADVDVDTAGSASTGFVVQAPERVILLRPRSKEAQMLRCCARPQRRRRRSSAIVSEGLSLKTVSRWPSRWMLAASATCMSEQLASHVACGVEVMRRYATRRIQPLTVSTEGGVCREFCSRRAFAVSTRSGSKAMGKRSEKCNARAATPQKTESQAVLDPAVFHLACSCLKKRLRSINPYVSATLSK